MARQVGSDQSIISNAMGGVYDVRGNAIASADNSFGSYPLGQAPINQTLFGVANATFDLLPPTPGSAMGNYGNPLPYWSVDDQSEGRMYVAVVQDSATQTYGVQFNPFGGSANDSIAITTRSLVVTDDNLALRQKAFASISRGSAYSGSTQWNMTLTATYYDHTNTVIGSAYAVGTAIDNASTFSSINGYTTSGGTAFSSSAAFVDIELRLNATSNVTNTFTATCTSVLLATSSATGGNFAQAVPFTSSGSWTAPISVSSVQLVMGGGGGGGGSGSRATGNFAGGGAGGGGGGVVYTAAVQVTGGSTYTVGIGTAGVGGTSVRGSASIAGVAGGAGGVTSFGTLVYTYGGLGGAGGATTDTNVGGAAGSVVGGGFGKVFINGGVGGRGGAGNGTAAGSGGAGQADIVITILNTAGSAGAGSAAGAGGALGFGGAGGGGAGGASSTGAAGGVGGGGGGGGKGTANGGTAGAGGNAGTYCSGGGGGGGAGNTGGTDVASSGPGGNGSTGWLVVLYQG